MRSTLILFALLVTGCGASPTGPSAAADPVLAGTWTGTITLSGIPTSSQTTWTFRSTAPQTYDAAIQGGLPPASLTATLIPPTHFDARGTVVTGGCRLDVSAVGTASRTHVSAALTTLSACGPTQTGRLELAR